MSKIYKTARKIYLFFLNDFVFSIKLLQTIFFDIKKDTVVFLNEAQLVLEITQGKSIIRFGDGETALILGESIHFQKYNKQLSCDLKKIIIEYNQDSNYILCVAERYIQASNAELRAKNLFNCWVVSKAYFRYRYNKNVTYGDAHMFYKNGFFEKNIAPLLVQKDIIVVTKTVDIAAKKDIFKKIFSNISWIEAPEKHSYDKMNEIYQYVIDIVKVKKNTVVFVSAGPMGKALAHQLTQKGIQTLDIGHGIVTLFEEDQSLQKILV